jgi:hypothetical protein
MAQTGGCAVHGDSFVPKLQSGIVTKPSAIHHCDCFPQWVEENGSQAYAQLLGSIAELVNADKLKLPTVRLAVGDGASGGASGVGSEELKAALLAATHGADGGDSDGGGAAGAAAARKKAAPGSVGGPLRGKKPRVFCDAILYQKDHFTKTGSGQSQSSQGKLKKGRVSAGSATSIYHPRPKICLELGTVEQARKTHLFFCAILY